MTALLARLAGLGALVALAVLDRDPATTGALAAAVVALVGQGVARRRGSRRG